MVYRELGKTGEKVSAIGVGGFHLGKNPVDEAGAIQLVHAAIDRGINFFDNSWDYNEGESERRMGKALKGKREKAFLMTKFDGRTGKTATEQLHESLERLQTDRVDLWQFHENNRMEDPDRFFAKGGAVEAMQAAQKAGKVRFFGFTGHKHPLVHLQMLEAADEHDFSFDACQMPLNVMDAHFRSFEKGVIPVLQERGIAVLAMKSMGDKNVLKAKVATPLECLKYALRLPTSVVITGIDSDAILDQALVAARTYQEWSDQDVSDLLDRTAKAAAGGEFEPFKTTEMFDFDGVPSGMARKPDDELMVEVWTYRLTEEGPDAALMDLLSPQEESRRQAFLFERHRREHLYAHALKRLALSRYRERDPRAWEFTVGEWGKPYIAGECGKLEFNLSHTAGLVACAVSDEGEVGVDVERVDRKVEAVQIARRFFADPEVRQIDVADEGLARAAFFRIWTLKEAYVKAVGRGFDLPLKSFWFLLNDHDGVQGPAGWLYSEFPIGAEYRMAVAGSQPTPILRDAQELLQTL